MFTIKEGIGNGSTRGRDGSPGVSGLAGWVGEKAAGLWAGQRQVNQPLTTRGSILPFTLSPSFSSVNRDPSTPGCEN